MSGNTLSGNGRFWDREDCPRNDWTPAEVYEAREHGVDKITRADGKEWWS